MTRYERHITADLAEQGWDAPALFRARRWRFLLTLIDALPSTSRTVAAVLNDPATAEETARAIVAAPQEDPDDTQARMRAQTPEVGVLQDIFDLLTAALGGKERYPRPVSAVALAVDAGREEAARKRAAEVLRALRPGWERTD